MAESTPEPCVWTKPAAPFDVQGWKEYVKWAEEHSVESRRRAYEEFRWVFPTSVRHCRKHVQWELSLLHHTDPRQKSEQVKRVAFLFKSCLPDVLDIQVWQAYVHFVQEQQVTRPNGNKKIEQAFEWAVKHMGCDIGACKLWLAYVEFLIQQSDKSDSHSNTGILNPNTKKVEEAKKLWCKKIRSVFQRAVFLPILDVEEIWKQYDKWEHTVNVVLATSMLNDLHPRYMVAKHLAKERKKVRLAILPFLLAVPSSQNCFLNDDVSHQNQQDQEIGPNAEKWFEEHVVREDEQWLKWQTVLNFEQNLSFNFKPATLHTKDKSSVDAKVSTTTTAPDEKDAAIKKACLLLSYRQALMHFRFRPIMWYSYSTLAAPEPLGIAHQPGLRGPSFQKTLFEPISMKAILKKGRDCMSLSLSGELLKSNRYWHLFVSVFILQVNLEEEQGRTGPVNDLFKEALLTEEKDQLTTGLCLHPRARQLLWRQWVLAKRRLEGYEPALRVFFQAFRLGNVDATLFAVMSQLTWAHTGDKTRTVRLFELGLQQMMTRTASQSDAKASPGAPVPLSESEQEMVCAYFDFLVSVNDLTNARALVHRVPATCKLAERALSLALQTGPLASVSQVEQGLSDATAVEHILGRAKKALLKAEGSGSKPRTQGSLSKHGSLVPASCPKITKAVACALPSQRNYPVLHQVCRHLLKSRPVSQTADQNPEAEKQHITQFIELFLDHNFSSRFCEAL